MHGNNFVIIIIKIIINNSIEFLPYSNSFIKFAFLKKV